MSSPPPPETLKTQILNYLSRFRSSILRLIPSSSDVPGILARSSSLYTPGYPTKSRRRKPGLPLPLRSGSLASIPDISETSRIIGVVDDVLEHILSSMHKIQKSLQFWQSRGEGKDVQKVYFMVFERGPRAFIDETIQLISRCAKEGPSLQHLCHSAATLIAEKISALSSLQYCLATFVSQVYVEVSKHEDLISKDPEKAFPLLLVAIDSLFSRLEVSILCREELLKTDSHPLFETLPKVDLEITEWRQADIRRAINMIYENIQRLDSYLSNLVSQYQSPRKITLHWLRYTGGAVGLSLCTVWLLRHSRLMGSSDIDDWFQEAKESTLAFWNSRVEEPILSIRDELFETFGRRHKGGVIEIEEVKLTADSLHRMLLAFTEQTKGQKIPENASDQELLEIVMSRYEKEVMHPIQNLFSGEIARALLIQIQKLKLDLETAMLELDQILKANEINFAILAALPAFFLSVSLLMLVRAWVLQDKGAEGRGRRARLQRRLLVAEIEKKILHLQTCRDRDLEEDAQWTFGMVLYYLDRLYKAAESHARDTGEWLSLRQDILDIGNPGMAIEHKLVLASRMEIVYECMLPSLKRF